MATHYQINVNRGQSQAENKKRAQSTRTDETFVYGETNNDMAPAGNTSLSAEYMSQNRKGSATAAMVTPQNEVAANQTHDVSDKKPLKSSTIPHSPLSEGEQRR